LAWENEAAMTESQQIKRKLDACEKKFFMALRECPLAVTLTSAIDHRYIEINETFEHITGWKRDEIIGRTPFDINIWIDPNQRTNFVKRLLAGSEARNIDVRARMKNREIRIGIGYASLIEIGGETCVLSLIADITDVKQEEAAKRSEEALSSMGRKLIEEHEEERASVARELGDYVERAALVSVELDRTVHNLPDWAVNVKERIVEARKHVEDLAMDIQTLAERLHSSELEYLGLVVAASNMCKQLARHKQLKIDFESEHIPEELPRDVKLCIFRVLQTALYGAISYTGARHLQVWLKGASDEIHVAVHDFGIGFDLDDQTRAGLVLSIIRERLKLVAGELSIQSDGGRGKTIHAHFPLKGKKHLGEV
jgi:PAS domain S-box-containing protein